MGNNKIYQKLSVRYLLLVVLPFILTSCEKVIDPDLKNTEPVFVIEGNISDLLENHVVKVTKTIPFDKANVFTSIKGAKVVLTSSTGQTVTFPEVADGSYRSPRFRGVAGVTYNLRVTVEGKTFEASSTMPKPVKADSLGFRKITIFKDSNIYPVVYYTDPRDTQNQYRFIMRINNKQIIEHVSEDRFNNGNTTSDLITFDGDGLVTGDKIDLEMQCIDRNVFKYYYSISQVDGEGGPPVAPANPDSNFSNGALGIFSAHSKSVYSITFKQ